MINRWGMGTLVFMTALGFSLLDAPSDAKEIYKWVDQKGTIHFSEDESGIPEEYREQVEKKSVSDEAKQPDEKAKVRKQDRQMTKNGEKEKINPNKIEGDVIETVKSILILWKEGKYRALYDCGNRKSRLTVNPEDFEHRMAKKRIGLASSWETFRDLQVEVRSATLAYATVRIGLKPAGGGETKFRTETYRMSLENGVWKIDLAKILSAKI